MKKKLILIGIGFVMILFIIILKIVNSSSQSLMGGAVSRAQVAKSVALAVHTMDECKSVKKDYFNNKKSTHWYEKYMNMMYTDGYMKVDEIKPDEKDVCKGFTYGDLKKLLKNMKLSDDDTVIKLKDKEEEDRIKLTEWYQIYYNLLKKIDTGSTVTEAEMQIVGTPSNMNNLGSWQVATDQGTYGFEGLALDYCIDYKVGVLVKDNEIILISEIIKKDITYENIWIIGCEDDVLHTYINGIFRDFEVKGVDASVQNTVGDIVLSNKSVKKISVKAETIHGKVLAIDNTSVEIEGYGKLEFTPNFRIYKTYGTIEQKSVNSILVGYDNQHFVVADGKVCASIINSDIDAENIRVLLTTSDFSSIFHDTVTIGCTGDYTLSCGEQTETHTANDVLSITKDSSYFTQGRIRLTPVDENSRLYITTIKRGYGSPNYRGSIEIALDTNGLLVINELSIEKYLYGVVPSEMPSSYADEALKAQAICARSYAYKQILNNAYGQYGAHVDDSTSYQVYNNSEEAESCNSAVDATYGKVMIYQGEPIEAFFFSTSCGSTTDATVWNGADLPYIKGKLLVQKEVSLDLTKEDEFRNFICGTYDTYDSCFPWYRWNVTISLSELTKSINASIGSRYSINPDNILTQKSDGSYESESVSSIGTLKKIEIGSRGTGGVIKEIILHGSDKTVKVMTEYNIRKLLSPYGDTINKSDGSTNESMSILPSAYFTINEVTADGSLSGYQFFGGGLGHGVGMSQNGAKSMADSGMCCEDILKFFYTDIELTQLY